jgi:hypothetical protein
VQNGYKEEIPSWHQQQQHRIETPACQLGSRGTELSWQLQNNGKKEINL